MNSLIKKIAVLLIVLLFLGAGALFFLLNTECFLEKNFPPWINSKFPAISVPHVFIGKQRFKFPGGFELTDVEFPIVRGDEKYSVSVESLEIEGLPRLFGQEKNFDVAITGLKIKGPSARINDANLTFHIRMGREGLQEIKGNLQIFETMFNKYKVKFVRTEISGDQDRMTCNDLAGGFYGGNIKGRIILDYRKNPNYLIEIKVTGVDLAQLRTVNKGLFSAVEGQVDGVLSVHGEAENVTSLQAFFKAPAGGKIKAFLLSPIIEQIPGNTQQRQELEKLIKEGGFIPLEKADIIIESLNEEKLRIVFDLESQKFNLDPNLTIDVNIDGGLGALLHHMEIFAP